MRWKCGIDPFWKKKAVKLAKQMSTNSSLCESTVAFVFGDSFIRSAFYRLLSKTLFPLPSPTRLSLLCEQVRTMKQAPMLPWQQGEEKCLYGTVAAILKIYWRDYNHTSPVHHCIHWKRATIEVHRDFFNFILEIKDGDTILPKQQPTFLSFSSDMSLTFSSLFSPIIRRD